MTYRTQVESAAGEDGSRALAVARRRWWVIALTTILAVGVAAIGLSLMTPSYQGTATLQVPISTGTQTPTDLTYLDRLMNTYTELAQQASFRTEVARQLGLGKAPSLSVTVEPNTELLQLAASDHSPALAQRTANVAAAVLVSRASGLAQGTSQAGESVLSSRLDALAATITSLKLKLASTPVSRINQRYSLQQTISGDQASYQALVQQRAQLQLADATRNQTLSLVQSASLPRSPASPKWPPVLALAVGLGLLGGLAIAFLLERFVPRLYTMESIEAAADADVLAAIPRVTGTLADSSLYNGGSPAQEAFGVLAVHILAEASARRLRTVLVTSRKQGDGKSTVAANLAAELARTGRRVVLVDADMRSPSVHGIFEVEPSPGLSDLLTSSELSTVLDGVIFRPERVPGLGVIPAGTQSSSAPQLLASERLHGLLDELSDQFDFIIIDAPPLVVSDPLSIARLTDLVLLVVGGGAVPDREVHAATRQLANIGVDNVSVVVNRWRGHEATYSYAYPSAP
jgi:capsular exopolysaccharide synthesis family protein